MEQSDDVFKYKEEEPVSKAFFRMLFSHFGLFVLVALYCALGAQLFLYLEQPAENERYKDKQLAAQVVEDTVLYTAQLFWFYGDPNKFNWTFDEFNRTLTKDLLRLESYILEAIEDNNYDGTIDGWDFQWTFMNSLLLCMTMLATIGYGNLTPVTFEGQMFCIGYALVGCSLFLVFLANIGSSMANGFTYIYSRLCCLCCRSRRYTSELPENTSTRFKKHVIDDIVGEEEYMPTSKLFVPIILNIVVLHLYFLIGGLLFSAWEYWDTVTSIYFTFITLSTIGYGDYVPGNSLTDDSESIVTSLKLLVTVLYIIFGMALLSMCISLMQEQLVEKFTWASQKLGFSKSNEVSEPKPYDKRKDSLMPLMENSKGSSPFRKTDSSYNADGNTGRPLMPGILEEGNTK